MLSKQIPFFFIENMSVLDSLLDMGKWQEFLEYKISKSHLTKTEEQNLIDFVNNKEYYNVAQGIIDGTYTFSRGDGYIQIGKQKLNKMND